MSGVERFDRILIHLRERGKLSVGEACDLLGVSVATVRRDFREMHRQNLARRIRGSILPAPVDRSGEIIPFALRQVRHSHAKSVLAARAAQLLQPHDVVIIDGGTTTYHLARHLPPFPLKVVTNSMRLASALDDLREERPNPEVHITGGFLYPGSGILLGPSANAGLAQYFAKWAFLSVGGLNEEGIYNTNELVSEAERVIVGNAEKVVVLADSSKLGHAALCRVCPLDEIDILVTNTPPKNPSLAKALARHGVEVILAPA